MGVEPELPAAEARLPASRYIGMMEKKVEATILGV